MFSNAAILALSLSVFINFTAAAILDLPDCVTLNPNWIDCQTYCSSITDSNDFLSKTEEEQLADGIELQTYEVCFCGQPFEEVCAIQVDSIVTPSESNEDCASVAVTDGDSCKDRCNNVIFRDHENKPQFFLWSTVSGCNCKWGTARVQACGGPNQAPSMVPSMVPSKAPNSSDAKAHAAIFSIALSVVVGASVVSI